MEDEVPLRSDAQKFSSIASTPPEYEGYPEPFPAQQQLYTAGNSQLPQRGGQSPEPSANPLSGYEVEHEAGEQSPLDGYEDEHELDGQTHLAYEAPPASSGSRSPQQPRGYGRSQLFAALSRRLSPDTVRRSMVI